MAISYPTGIDALTNPTSGQGLNSPSHSSQHADANDAIEALEAKVGVNSSAVTTSHDYKLGEVTGTDKAVGKTAIQTLTNKTLTSPAVNLGSDATGDMYYRNSGGALTRLPIGTSGQILNVDGTGIPAYVANPAAADASTTVKGVVEIATTAEITAGTSLGGTGAKLVIPADAVGSTANKIVQLDSSARLPAVDASLLINVPNPITYKSGTTTFDSSTTTTTTIAHGLGKTPKFVRVKAIYAVGTSDAYAHGSYNGTNQYCIYRWHDTNGSVGGVNSSSSKILHLSYGNGSGDSNYNEGVASIDATNITITWTKTSSPTGTYQILWEAEA